MDRQTTNPLDYETPVQDTAPVSLLLWWLGTVILVIGVLVFAIGVIAISLDIGMGFFDVRSIAFAGVGVFLCWVGRKLKNTSSFT